MMPQTGNEAPLLSDAEDCRVVEIAYLRRILAQTETIKGDALINSSLSLEANTRNTELALAERLKLLTKRADDDPGWLIDLLTSEESDKIFPNLDQSDEPVKPRKFTDLVASREAERN